MKSTIAVAVLALIGVLLPATPAAAACPAPGGGSLPHLPDTSDEIVFRGRGWGHGTGMSQYGAKGAAEGGCTHDQILSTYYPGTKSATRASEFLRLSMNHAAVKATVAAPTKRANGTANGDVHWQLCEPSGADSTCQDLADTVSTGGVQQPGETWIARVRQDSSTATSRIRIEKLVDGKWELVHEHSEDGIVRVVLKSVNRDELGPEITLSDGQRTRQLARGVLEIDPTENGADTAFVTLLIGMEQYLYGLGEIPTSWHIEALRTQVVAARSYAYQRIDARQHTSKGLKECRCHLYATTKDQNYVGYGKEAESSNGTNWGARWVQAVRDTSEKIRTYDGKPIPAFYSSVHGGSSESYAFWSGGSERPYLQAVDDSAWEARADAPLSAWAVGVSAARLGKVLGVGDVVDVDLPKPRGAHGRIGRPDAGYGGVVIRGKTGTWTGSGADLRDALKVLGADCGERTSAGATQRLCSTLFTADVNLGPPPPPPTPPPTGAIRLTGDWDGDGRDTAGWFKDGRWGLHDSHSPYGSTLVMTYGGAGDIPVVGDWDGDGNDTIGVVRPTSDGRLRWILRNKYVSGNEALDMYYGVRGDIPVVGDWDGDGDDTIGVVRNGNRWILRNRYVSGNKALDMRYGEPGDVPVTGDWDGNGTDTVGIVRGNRWILRNRYVSGNEALDMEYGISSDVQLTGDWDADGIDTIGIVRDRLWVLRNVYKRDAVDYKFNF